MKKEEMKKERLYYVRPSIGIVAMETEWLICASVKPSSTPWTEEEWEEGEEIGGEGEIEIEI